MEGAINVFDSWTSEGPNKIYAELQKLKKEKTEKLSKKLLKQLSKISKPNL